MHRLYGCVAACGNVAHICYLIAYQKEYQSSTSDKFILVLVTFNQLVKCHFTQQRFRLVTEDQMVYSTNRLFDVA